MAQDSHGNPRMHVERGQQSGTGMPHVVHGDTADARFGAAGLKTTVQVPRLERRTGPVANTSPLSVQEAPAAASAAAWSFSRMRNAVMQMAARDGRAEHRREHMPRDASQSAHVPYSRVSSTRHSPTSKTTAPITQPPYGSFATKPTGWPLREPGVERSSVDSATLSLKAATVLTVLHNSQSTPACSQIVPKLIYQLPEALVPARRPLLGAASKPLICADR